MNSEDLKNYIKERLNSTFIFTFLVSMGFHYWKIVLIVLSTEINVLTKIEHIDKLLLQLDSLSCNIFVSLVWALGVTGILVLSKRISVFINSGLDILTMNIVTWFQEKFDKSNLGCLLILLT